MVNFRGVRVPFWALVVSIWVAWFWALLKHSFERFWFALTTGRWQLAYYSTVEAWPATFYATRIMLQAITVGLGEGGEGRATQRLREAGAQILEASHKAERARDIAPAVKALETPWEER